LTHLISLKNILFDLFSGKDKQQHYNEKFGEEMLRRGRPHLVNAGKQSGINFAFGGIAVALRLQAPQAIRWSYIGVLWHSLCMKDRGKQGNALPARNASHAYPGLIANTMNAHRLLELAAGDIGAGESLTEDQLVKRQNSVVEALYKVYPSYIMACHYKAKCQAGCCQVTAWFGRSRRHHPLEHKPCKMYREVKFEWKVTCRIPFLCARVAGVL
jgi:hypothetical protein